MADQASSIHEYVNVLQDPSDEHLESLSNFMAPDVVVVGMVGAGEGLDAVREALARPPRPGLLSTATAGAPSLEGDAGTVELTLAPGAPIAGLDLHVTFDAEHRISRVEQQMHGAPPPPPIALSLTDDVKQAIAGALMNGTPVVVAYVDAEGVPHLSLRGSTQPYSDTQLAIWVRDPGGGMLRALPTNPAVALFYRDPATRAAYTFTGRASIATDPDVRDTVYAHTPAPERNIDARRLGSAVIVDLDRVEGMGPAGRFVMVR